MIRAGLDPLSPALKMEKGAVSQGMWAAPGSWKGLEMDSPLEPPEGMQPCWHLDFSPVRPRPTFDLRNCEITNLYCFKALDFTLICYRQLNTIILVNSNYNNFHEHGVFPLCYALFSVLNMY